MGNLCTGIRGRVAASNRLLQGIGPQAISEIWTRSITQQQAIRGTTHKRINAFIDRDGARFVQGVVAPPLMYFKVHIGRRA
jgi:hypothetical protein